MLSKAFKKQDETSGCFHAKWNCNISLYKIKCGPETDYSFPYFITLGSNLISTAKYSFTK